MSNNINITIYTDGGCLPNPGNGGCASILLHKTDKATIFEKIIIGCARNSTNNRMEIMAVLNAMRSLTKPCNLTIYSDSQYVNNTIGKWENHLPIEAGWIIGWERNNWTKKKGQLLNVDLWKLIIFELRKHRSVTMVWVKGHSDDYYNTQCDVLATQARETLLDKTAPEGTFVVSDWCKQIRK